MKKVFFTFENEDGYDFLENLVIDNKKIDAFFIFMGSAMNLHLH